LLLGNIVRLLLDNIVCADTLEKFTGKFFQEQGITTRFLIQQLS